MEKSQLASTMASTNPWVAPAESARTRMGWATRAGWSSAKWPAWYSSGSPDSARWSRSTWSSASLAPAFPGRSMAASGSLVVSHHTPNGKNPKPFL